MKPVIIIAIAVVCSVVAVLGVLVAFSTMQQMEFEEKQKELQSYYGDLDLAESYKLRYWNIMEKYCPPPFPESFREAEIQLEQLKVKLIGLSSNQELPILHEKMDLLAQKYPDSDYFVLEHSCPYSEDWDKLHEALLNYQGQLTTEQSQKVSDFVSNQLKKCLEKDNQMVCNARLGEFTETAKLVLGYN